MDNNYQADSIKTLDYFSHIRQYPGMYIGSKDINGLHHCLKEIVSNSIDEYLNNAGNKIEVTLRKDGGVSVKDNGRGIPHGKHPSGCSILQACYSIANTGGKFNNATGETGYNTSGGEHGVGGKAVNALSKRMKVSSSRDGETEVCYFERGKIVEETSFPSKDETGVEVWFLPDDEIFETVQFDSNRIKAMIQEFSYLCTGLTFVYTDEIAATTETFYSDKGLYDYLNYLNKGKLITNPIYFEEKDGTFQLEVALAYNEGYSNLVKLYTNNIPQEKGTHLTGFKTALTKTVNAIAREKKWLKDKDANLTGADLEEGQILIINFKMIDPIFKGQNKEELSSSEGRTYVERLASQGLRNYFAANEKDIKAICDKALSARKAREAAKKAREAIRNGTTKDKKSKILNLPTKLVDAYDTNRSNCELFIAEGDSAASGLVDARDPKTQAVFPIRGKIISCLKQSTEKILANQEVVNIIKALGLELNTKTCKLTYDQKKLRYDKIIMASDADSDGLAIKNLLLTMFWALCPELVVNGHIYAANPPLFRVTTKKNEYVFLRDKAALEEYAANHQGEKYLVNRNKGFD